MNLKKKPQKIEKDKRKKKASKKLATNLTGANY